jgi:hypothetical protein
MKIFISYRRDDTQDFAGRLADKLRAAKGISEVFLDVDEIAIGEDFAHRIEASLAQCSVCLVVIGTYWAGASPGTAPRITEPGDFVRVEVQKVLASQKQVLPILANGATMPRSEDLPEDLKRLTALNALSVRHSDFERDTEHLLDAIFARKKPGHLAAFLRRHPALVRLLESLSGAAAAMILLILMLAVLNATTGRSLDEVVGGEGPAIILALTIAALGALAPWYLRQRGLLR